MSSTNDGVPRTAFIPTHYTAGVARFYGETYYDSKLRQPNEAVMSIDGPNMDGLIKVCDGDGYTAWLHPERDLYRGPRRANPAQEKTFEGQRE